MTPSTTASTTPHRALSATTTRRTRMDQLDEQYENGFTEGYEWGKYVMAALDDREPFWNAASLSNAIAAITELPDTAELRTIREAMILGRDQMDERSDRSSMNT